MKKTYASIDHFYEIEGIRSGSPIFLGLGLLMMLLGCGAIFYSTLATIASVVFLGGIFVSAGIAHLIHSFWVRQWKGVFVSVLLSAFLGILGCVCIFSPVVTSLALTLLIGVFFLVTGTIRVLSAVFLRFDRWGWYFLNGFVSFILGMLIFAGWPASGLWVIGLFIGIDILLVGISWVFLANSLVRD